jgi:hypothetical protein
MLLSERRFRNISTKSKYVKVIYSLGIVVQGVDVVKSGLKNIQKGGG